MAAPWANNNQFNSQYTSVNDPSLFRRGPNPAFQGMNTQYVRGDTSDINADQALDNARLMNTGTFNDMNIIERKGISNPRDVPDVREPKFINRQYKLIIHSSNKISGTHGDYIIRLQETIKGVCTARLLSAILYSSGGDPGEFDEPTEFVTLHIDRFGKNKSTTNGGLGDRLHDSFAVLDYKGNTVGTTTIAYNNTYRDNYDLKYFDPPISLSEMHIQLYNNAGANTGDTYINKLEILLETTETMRDYRV